MLTTKAEGPTLRALKVLQAGRVFHSNQYVKPAHSKSEGRVLQKSNNSFRADSV